jgi:hypothetical protein
MLLVFDGNDKSSHDEVVGNDGATHFEVLRETRDVFVRRTDGDLSEGVDRFFFNVFNQRINSLCTHGVRRQCYSDNVSI